jgi:soluble lytic murein transglycosylase-like protein
MSIDISSASSLQSGLQNLEQKKTDSLLQLATTTQEHLNDARRAEYAKAARGFESMFVSMMMKQMKTSMLDEDKEEGEDMSFGADTLQGYADMQFADQVARSGQGMGLASMIYKQLTGGESLPTITVDLPGMIKSRTQQQDASIIENQPLSKTPVKTAQAPEIPASGADIHPADTLHQRASQRIEKYQPAIMHAAQKHNVPEAMIKAVITAESAGRHDAVSPVGAKGLMQLMDQTADSLGVKNVFDPVQNIQGGTRYLGQMLKEFGGNIDLALAAYNAGPGNVRKYGDSIPPFRETQAYVRRVKNYMERFNQ